MLKFQQRQLIILQRVPEIWVYLTLSLYVKTSDTQSIKSMHVAVIDKKKKNKSNVYPFVIVLTF